jgi:putative proteasome-type protease
MIEVADSVGRAVRGANRELLEALGPDKAKSGCSLLLGGRIGGGRPRLFLVYPEGNHIECQREVPFLQIGETKYGRPILDRILHPSTPLPAAIKVALLSFDSAMRSNLSIALPLDMVAMPAAPALPAVSRRIGQGDPYFAELSRRWSATLAEAADAMPDPAFVPELAPPRPLTLVAETRG